MIQARIVRSYVDDGALVVHAAVEGEGRLVVEGQAEPIAVEREYRVCLPLAELEGLSQAQLADAVRQAIDRERLAAGVTAPAPPKLPKTLSLD